jgi:hypothetical protein
MSKTLLSIIVISLCAFIFSCGGPRGPKLKQSEVTGTANAEPGDTLSDELQCKIKIDDKEFTVPADSISTAYTFSDSSFVITMKGVGTGLLRLDVPDFFKCPYKIPTGYTSVRFKMYESVEFSTEPTVYLQNYAGPGLEFNNLVDGHTKTAVKENAFEVTAVRKIAEDSSNNWAAYILKGKIHATVFKSSYEAKGNDRNYEVNGQFVIKTKINFQRKE